VGPLLSKWKIAAQDGKSGFCESGGQQGQQF
jgi:hypothetical protein